ncbi:MAG TPA: hypothetical protein VFP55_13690 [Solirubrobacteraceae bacterium]|nr:hypothetical protein [Solirubrobacteraceae bacterium]
MTEDDRVTADVELELRERLTLLEDWRERASATLGLLALGGLALAVAVLSLRILIGKATR